MSIRLELKRALYSPSIHLKRSHDEYYRKAFEFAGEASKLLITLSTGVIAFMMAFLDKESYIRPMTNPEKTLLIFLWVIFLFSASAGIWKRLGITTVLEPKIKQAPFSPTIQSDVIKVPFRIQIVLFVVGVIVTVIYAVCKFLEPN